MQYINHYESPLGGILLAADGIGLTGLWFEGQKYYARTLDEKHEEKDLEVFRETRRWLDIYFAGQEPDFMPDVHLTGTQFQVKVWELLRQIPYGQTVTYGEIARRLSIEEGGNEAGRAETGGTSARAVGGAAGHNKISIIIPCHRVVGADGSLTGYAGGVERKVRLLQLEKADLWRNFQRQIPVQN